MTLVASFCDINVQDKIYCLLTQAVPIADLWTLDIQNIFILGEVICLSCDMFIDLANLY